MAYLLLVTSILMLAVPVFPHHHHADGLICMKNDVAAEYCQRCMAPDKPIDRKATEMLNGADTQDETASAEETASADGTVSADETVSAEETASADRTAVQEHRADGHEHCCCNTGCVTTHFFQQTSQQTDDAALAPHCLLLLACIQLLPEGLLPAGLSTRPSYNTYIETLHGTLLMRATGLRAPPAVLA